MEFHFVWMLFDWYDIQLNWIAILSKQINKIYEYFWQVKLHNFNSSLLFKRKHIMYFGRTNASVKCEKRIFAQFIVRRNIFANKKAAWMAHPNAPYFSILCWTNTNRLLTSLMGAVNSVFCFVSFYWMTNFFIRSTVFIFTGKSL